jgi:2-dehydro-3-deoxy-D-arabinonate dehydratase
LDTNSLHSEVTLKDKIILAPIGVQEVWAAGVTYYRSKQARMEESADSGGSTFYDKVYDADRPELFFKALPRQTVGINGNVGIRKDSKWNVPEPELTLFVTSNAKIVAYTIGNDMSSRDIEGENLLYLPQAKMYNRCAGLGPCLYITDVPLDSKTTITLQIKRSGMVIFEGNTQISQMKRKPEELVGYLFRETDFPNGCFLMTGTGVVPPDHFTLAIGDEILITIPPIGTLRNLVG